MLNNIRKNFFYMQKLFTQNIILLYFWLKKTFQFEIFNDSYNDMLSLFNIHVIFILN